MARFAPVHAQWQERLGHVPDKAARLHAAFRPAVRPPRAARCAPAARLRARRHRHDRPRHGALAAAARACGGVLRAAARRGRRGTQPRSQRATAGGRHAPIRRRPGPRFAGARRLPGGTLRCPGVVPGLTHRSAQGRLGYRSSGASARTGRRAPRRRHAVRAAVGHLRAKTLARLSTGQARLRAGAHRIRNVLLDRAADGFFQVAVGPARAGQAGQTLPGVRRRHPDGLQTDQRQRPGRLSGRLPGRREPAQPGAAHRRAGRCDHTAPAGRTPVRPARAHAAHQACAGRPARRHRRPARRHGPGAAHARRQGGAGAHRPLLRHRIDAGARPDHRALRCRRHAVFQ